MLRGASCWVWVLLALGSLSRAIGATEAPKPAARAAPAPAAEQPAKAASGAKAPADLDDYEMQRLLVDTVDQVQRNYVREISRRKIVEAAIKGILAELDPYSSYISPEEMDRFRTVVESEFGGIGIQVEVDRREGLKVISPLVGTPAFRAGLVAGDRIVEINGATTIGLSMDDAVRRLKGKQGTSVVIKVLHAGKTAPEEVRIRREAIHLETVQGDRRKADNTWDYLLDPAKRIAYIRVSGFSRETAAELRKVLTDLQKEKIRGLILDLRFNPGGLLSSAIEVSDLFVSEGRIVSTAGRNSPERVWEAHKEGTFEGFPMVVLVNRFSASASEIVAACLQDHKRAGVAGERTWGKGSVQNVIPLDDFGVGGDPAARREPRSALKLTTAGYHRPSGKNIDRAPGAKDGDDWGVRPDAGLERKLDDPEMMALMAERRQREIIAAKQPGKAAPQAKPEKPFVDRQLEAAVDYLNAEMARAQ